MEPSVFRALRDLAFQQAGIRLGEHKAPLVAARVGTRVRALGLSGEGQYLEVLRRDPTGGELVAFLDVISTNFTSFFREPDHFDRLADAVRRRLQAGQRRFRFWSAAASTGEEPYTAALVLAGLLEGTPADWRILATDLSTRALRTAAEGVYGDRQLEAVPAALRDRWFVPTGKRGPDGRSWRVSGALRERVLFKRLNLAAPPFPPRGPLDAIFCRNVMIYLGAEARQAIVAEAERLLRPGGLLFIGHAETLAGIRTGLESMRSSVYRKAG